MISDVLVPLFCSVMVAPVVIDDLLHVAFFTVFKGVCFVLLDVGRSYWMSLFFSVELHASVF